MLTLDEYKKTEEDDERYILRRSSSIFDYFQYSERLKQRDLCQIEDNWLSRTQTQSMDKYWSFLIKRSKHFFFQVRTIETKCTADTEEANSANIEEVFRELADQWLEETAPLSSIQKIILHPAYQKIIGLGEKAVPLIIDELSREPNHWFWALTSITRENPIKPEDAGNLKAMTKAWLDLAEKRGWNK